ncbi:MAG TPA: peptidase M13, partial [Lactococcus sp.]|nr:peptidase M13 [Lactococcus sp.]
MTRIQDDLFIAVNAEWLAQAQIPSDKPRISAFDELVLINEKNLTADLQKMSVELPEDNPELLEAIKFYNKAGDWEARNNSDFSSVSKELDKVQKLESFEDFREHLLDLVFHSQASLPFSMNVEADMKDAVHHSLGFIGPDLILPDTTYYSEEHPRKRELLEFWQKNSGDILEKFHLEDAREIAAKAVAFDSLLVDSANTSEEWAKYAELYHPVPFEEFVDHFENIDFRAFVKGLVHTEPEKIVVFEKRFYENFDSIVNEENWPLIKAWMLVKIARKASGLLSDELRLLGSAYGRFLSNVAEARSQEKHQLDITEGYFSQVIGLFYG